MNECCSATACVDGRGDMDFTSRGEALSTDGNWDTSREGKACEGRQVGGGWAGERGGGIVPDQAGGVDEDREHLADQQAGGGGATYVH